MREGDLLFLYTDGVTEALDAGGREFGDQHLIDVLSRGGAASAAQWVARMEAAVREFARGKPPV